MVDRSGGGEDTSVDTGDAATIHDPTRQSDPRFSERWSEAERVTHEDGRSCQRHADRVLVVCRSAPRPPRHPPSADPVSRLLPAIAVRSRYPLELSPCFGLPRIRAGAT